MHDVRALRICFLRYAVWIGRRGGRFLPRRRVVPGYWYPNRLRSQVWAIFSLGVPLASFSGGPLSGGIMRSLDGAYGLRGWQRLFLLEGLPAIVLGLINSRFMDDGPAEAKWLSSEAKQAVQAQSPARAARKNARGYGSRVVDALKDSNTWLMSWTDFTLLGSTYGLSFWLPQIIKNLGVNDLFHNGLITSIPYGFAAVGMIVIARHSDRHNERRWQHASLCAVAAAVGLAMSGVFAAMWCCVLRVVVATVGALPGCR